MYWPLDLPQYLDTRTGPRLSSLDLPQYLDTRTGPRLSSLDLPQYLDKRAGPGLSSLISSLFLPWGNERLSRPLLLIPIALCLHVAHPPVPGQEDTKGMITFAHFTAHRPVWMTLVIQTFSGPNATCIFLCSVRGPTRDTRCQRAVGPDTHSTRGPVSQHNAKMPLHLPLH